MDFWAHGLTNVQHTSKIYIKNIYKFKPSKFEQSWFFEFMV